MKKRTQKLSIHRDTVVRLDQEIRRQDLREIEGGILPGCTGCMSGCGVIE